MRHEILRRLRQGPATNRQLQVATDNYWSGAIARDVSKLVHAGRVVRIDGGSGRGKPATYALAGMEECWGCVIQSVCPRRLSCPRWK